MNLGKFLGVLNFDILPEYLHSLSDLLVVIEHFMNISIGEACLADALMADHDDLPVEVRALISTLGPAVH